MSAHGWQGAKALANVMQTISGTRTPMELHSITVDHCSSFKAGKGYCSCMFKYLTSKLQGPGCWAIQHEPLWAKRIRRVYAGIGYHHPAYPPPLPHPKSHVGFKGPWWKWPWILKGKSWESQLCAETSLKKNLSQVRIEREQALRNRSIYRRDPAIISTIHRCRENT